MDNTISQSIATTQANTDAIGMAVLKKANEVEAESAMQLVASSSAHLPSHLGRNINTTA